MGRRHRRKHRRSIIATTVSQPGARHALATPDALYSPESISVIGYGPAGYEEHVFTKVEDIATFSSKWPVLWIDIDGLGNSPLILALGKYFCLPTLVLEDVFDVSRLPKIEEYEKFLFIIMKNGICTEMFETEQISLIVMDNIVISIQEKPGDSYTQVRSRIRDGAGKIRQFGSDYLAYALMDATLEGYFPILEVMKRRLDAIEDTFIDASGHNVIRQIHDIKNDLLFMHSAVWPVRDIMLTLSHDDIPVIKPATAPYIRDCQDQAKQVTELTEFYRLIASDLMNTYLAFSDNKANEIMKVLTMVATIFIPLSFITSLYGMNFDRSASPYNMPELGMRYGYLSLLAFMATIATFILGMFWRFGWIGSRRRRH